MAARQHNSREIVTQRLTPPIPVRCCDWTATYADYDLGDPIGYGATEEEAINDLIVEAEA